MQALKAASVAVVGVANNVASGRANILKSLIDGKRIARVSFVPVCRDANNDVFMLDPSDGDGAKLLQVVKDRSATPPPLRIDGHEVVLMDTSSRPTGRR